jgi:peptidyl-prolyl cis-trans isomerase B (cyclophilin B)
MTQELVFDTSHGTFAVALEPDSSPATTTSVVDLAGKGFFDGTHFHRIVPGFVIQGGDPTGTGTGGPGYKTVDPPEPGTRYTKGVVAMAKTADEAPGTAGSQFFVVTAEDAGLPPEYAVIGRVSEGLEVVEEIGLLAERGSERPSERVVIESCVVRET